jgi:hypothetical protein
MKHGNIYLHRQTNEEYVLCQCASLWYLLPIYGRHHDSYSDKSTQHMGRILYDKFDIIREVNNVPTNNNISLSGDEARVLMGLITDPKVTFTGNILVFVNNLYTKLRDIHLVQPPGEKK